ncbi:MAG: inositol monophosphatase family protein [Candidatus Auribacterota bacterium]|nr:inositol monophosphatase family protein [Candidatus Auribacterota bacterium]
MYDELLQSAILAAKTAGKMIKDASRNKISLDIETKAKNDFVTNVDKASEACIKKILIERHPDYAVMAEESSSAKTIPPDRYWVIDPLDGTTNYIHGFPPYCVSIGLCEGIVPILGVIYDPTRDELFHAAKGQGAYLNGKPIKVSGCENLSDGLIATGFLFRDMDVMEQCLNCFKEVLQKCQGVRRPGAAAIDLAYVACGRLDGFWEQGLYPWDASAGSVIVMEAGGTVTNFHGGESYLFDRTIVATNSKIHFELQSIVQRFMPATFFQ